MAEKESKYDPLFIEKVFPEPTTLLTNSQPAVRDMVKGCLFVLDANTLLAPFLIGKDSLKDVRKVLSALVREDRLFLPAQATREYAKHRASKMAEIYTHIQQKLSSLPSSPQPLAIPMLEDDPPYRAVIESAEKVRGAIKEYKVKLQELLGQIKDWHGNDPVTKLYASIFQSIHIIDHGMSAERLLNDLGYRTTHGVPPGFKDKAKADGGVGDVAIWNTILKLGTDKRRDVIFVSNDGKSDWMVRGGEEGLFPRFELIEEFRRSTGQHFWMLSFDRFLEMLGAAPGTVDEVAATTDVASSTSIPPKVTSYVTMMLANPETLGLEAVLSRLRSIIESFLEPDDSNEADEYDYIQDHSFGALGKRCEKLVFEHLKRHERMDALAGIFLRILEVLNRMSELNGRIAYHAARMKRSADAEQKELSELAQEFISLHDQYNELYAILE